MTQLQELLHEYCPQMDIVDIIIDYKTGIENQIIDYVGKLSRQVILHKRHIKLLTECKKKLPPNCIVTTMQGYKQALTRHKRLKKKHNKRY